MEEVTEVSVDALRGINWLHHGLMTNCVDVQKALWIDFNVHSLCMPIPVMYVYLYSYSVLMHASSSLILYK